MSRLSLLPTLAALLALSSCASEDPPRLQSRGYQEVQRDANGQIIYVDTHDDYAHASMTRPVDRTRFDFFDRLGGKRAVALSFDCAWVAEADGMELLDALAARKVRATFFISGPFIFADYQRGLAGGLKAGSKAMVRRMIDDGHSFGNHTWTHPFLADRPAYHAELTELDRGWTAMVASLYGSQPPSNAALRPFWRAPYGEYDARALTTAGCSGYPYHFGWNVDVLDTTGKPDCALSPATSCWSGTKMTDRVLAFAALNPALDAMVVLAHLSNAYHWGKQASGLDRLIGSLQGQGYAFATLEEILKFDSSYRGPSPASPTCAGLVPSTLPPGTPPAFIGEACTSASGCSTGQCLLPSGTAPGMCSQPCVRYCPDQTGKPTTFCATAPSGSGQCFSRCDPTRSDSCRTGYRCIPVKRHNEAGVVRNICVPSSWPMPGKADSPEEIGDEEPVAPLAGCAAVAARRPVGLVGPALLVGLALLAGARRRRRR